jgi:hypothetical protein
MYYNTVLPGRMTAPGSVDRYEKLTWFIPALTNRRLGSPRGRTGDEGTYRCWCFCSKKSINVWRTFLEENLVEYDLLRCPPRPFIRTKTFIFLSPDEANKQQRGFQLYGQSVMSLVRFSSGYLLISV